jgi:FAD-dependent oxidoreductase family protein
MADDKPTPRWYEEGARTTPDTWFVEGDAPTHAERDEPTATYSEPAREIPVHAETDVLVVGGGPAGCAAATAAARLGAQVTLVERYGHLGGLATGGLVFWIDRMTDWEGRQVIAGYAADVFERLTPESILGPAPEVWGSRDPADVKYWKPRAKAFRDTVTWSPTIDPEWLKIVSYDLLHEAGAKPLLHSWAVQTIVEGADVRGVVFESKQGRRAILAKVIVDASGDLDLCALAGAPYESDIDTGDVNHCMNVAWCWAGVDMNRWQAFADQNVEAYQGLKKQGAALLGYVETPMFSWRNDVCLFLGPRLSGYSGVDVEDLTSVELESRRRMVEHLAFYRENAPGFEDAWLMTTASQIGIRHTRRLSGVRKMLNTDWKAAVRHEDEIGVSPSPGPKFAPVSVPYGAIVSAELDGLLAPGRHVACDPSTQSFMREIPQCWLTGQAAGVAAALAVAHGQRPRDIDVRELQAQLLRQGAYLQVAARA